MVPVINVDVYLFWFSQTWPVTLRTVPPDSEETELGSSDHEASSSAGKNTRVALVPYLRMEVRPYSYFRWCKYF